MLNEMPMSPRAKSLTSATGKAEMVGKLLEACQAAAAACAACAAACVDPACSSWEGSYSAASCINSCTMCARDCLYLMDRCEDEMGEMAPAMAKPIGEALARARATLERGPNGRAAEAVAVIAALEKRIAR